MLLFFQIWSGTNLVNLSESVPKRIWYFVAKSNVRSDTIMQVGTSSSTTKLKQHFLANMRATTTAQPIAKPRVHRKSWSNLMSIKSPGSASPILKRSNPQSHPWDSTIASMKNEGLLSWEMPMEWHNSIVYEKSDDGSYTLETHPEPAENLPRTQARHIVYSGALTLGHLPKESPVQLKGVTYQTHGNSRF